MASQYVCPKGCNGVGYLCKTCRKYKEFMEDPEMKALRELNQTDEMFFDLIEQVENKGNNEAKRKLFEAYRNREDAQQSFSESMITVYEQMVEIANSSFAMSYLGVLYGYLPKELEHIRALGIQCDYAKSFEYYKRAVLLKNTLAVMNIGIILSMKEIPEDHERCLLDCIQPFVNSGELAGIVDRNTLVEELFKISILLDPTNVMAYDKLVEWYLSHGVEDGQCNQKIVDLLETIKDIPAICGDEALNRALVDARLRVTP